MSVIHALNNFSQLASARLVQLTNLAGVYFNGPTNNGVGATLTASSAALLTIDSVDVEVGDRVLLMGQTLGYENGLYEVIAAGSASSLWQLQRTGDFQCMEQLQLGANVYIFAGTVNAGACFVLTEPLPAAIGVPVTAGDNDINFTASPLNSALGTMAAQDASAVAITGGSIAGITDLAVADGGTGASTGPLALTSLGVKRATTAAYGGGGTSNAFTATGLAATDIVVATILASTNSVAITKAVPTANTLTITFSADPGAGTTVQWHALPA